MPIMPRGKYSIIWHCVGRHAVRQAYPPLAGTAGMPHYCLWHGASHSGIPPYQGCRKRAPPGRRFGMAGYFASGTKALAVYAAFFAASARMESARHGVARAWQSGRARGHMAKWQAWRGTDFVSTARGTDFVSTARGMGIASGALARRLSIIKLKYIFIIDMRRIIVTRQIDVLLKLKKLC